MHDDRSGKLSPAAAAIAVGALLVLLAGAYTWCGSTGARQAAAPQHPATTSATARPRPSSAPQERLPFARDQLFFVGRDREAERPVLAAMILQREPQPGGAIMEAKAFIVWRGRWYPPFYEQIELDHWPGADLEAALDAYAHAGGRALRLSWTEGDGQLHATFRSASAQLELETARLADAGSGDDPHGTVSWRRGRGSLAVGRRTVDGVVLHERLSTPRQRLPKFGRFEMWLYAPPSGGLVLGRCALSAAAASCAPVVSASPKGAAAKRPFGVEVLTDRDHAETGFALPSSWRVRAGNEPVELVRRRGLVIVGKDPNGKPAAYDFALAEQEGGKAAGLVFHLQDEAEPKATSR